MVLLCVCVCVYVCVCVCVGDGTDLFSNVSHSELNKAAIATTLRIHFHYTAPLCCLTHHNTELHTCLSLVWTYAHIHNSSKTIIRLKQNTKITRWLGSLFSFSSKNLKHTTWKNFTSCTPLTGVYRTQTQTCYTVKSTVTWEISCHLLTRYQHFQGETRFLHMQYLI
jgi:hypothetical protein